MTMLIGTIRAPRAGTRTRSAIIGGGPVKSRGFQIGPKIRIGGTLGKIGQNVKIATGKALSNPIVDGALTLIPGVGPGIAAAAGAAGRALDTSNGGLHGLEGLGSLAAGAAKGYGAGKVAGGLKTAAASLLGKGAASAAGTLAPTDAQTAAANDAGAYSPDGSNAAAGIPSGGGDFLSRLKGLVTGGGADKTGSLGALGDMLGKVTGGGGGGGSLMDELLLGGSVASAAADKARQQGLQDKSVKYATDAYDEKAPLRTKALASLSTDQAAPDLSSIFANPGNVYDRQRRGLPPMTTGPSAASLNTGGQALSGALASRVRAPAAPAPVAALPAPAPANPMATLANSYQ